MHIIHIASEYSPIAKVGGLGDAVAGLAKALQKEGVKVEVLLPFYDLIDTKNLSNLKIKEKHLLSYEDMEECENTIWSAEIDGIPIFLIKPKNTHNYFDRKTIYGEEDDVDRFLFFCRTALEFLKKRKINPNVIHIHDWLTAFIAPLYYEMYHSFGVNVGGIALTLHNLQHQGTCPPHKLNQIGVQGDLFLQRNKLQDHKDPNKLNLLKGGILYADALTTVSPTYAKEITVDQGFGLEHLLIDQEKKLTGIINGLDTTYWDPEIDPCLKRNYPHDFLKITHILEGKKVNRKTLSDRFQMKSSDAPLVACITRLVDQKGPELIEYGLQYILKKGGQCVLLASNPNTQLKEKFHALQQKLADNPNIYFYFGYDEALAHLLYAASDFILIPSLFEPCGLTQMIALRYGTIPIVHKVGGLADTIFDIDHSDISEEKRNGYVFDMPTFAALSTAIDRAFDDFKNNRAKFLSMLKQGFSHDWSWQTSVQCYLKIYNKIAY